MIPYNFHIHSTFSDGSSPLWQILQKAAREGFTHIAATDHGPLPFENEWSIGQSDRKDYIRVIDEQRELLPDVQIFRGLEMDYIPGTSRNFDELKDLWQLDFKMGSVHLVKQPESGKLWFIDGPVANYDNGLERFFRSDIVQAVKTYYHQINQMLRTQKPDILGHVDKIRMNNMDRFFNESDSWYQDLLEECLDTARQSKTIVEVNPRGFYKGKTSDLFPSMRGLEIISHMDIPVMINTDAHGLDELSAGQDEAVKQLKAVGIRSVKYLTRSGWEDHEL